jgi:hypothetical protein
LEDAGWGLRYLKLRISRKLTFVGSLVPLLLVALRRPDNVHAFLLEQYVSIPPLARIAQLSLDLGEDAIGQQALAEILFAADRFAGFLADPALRAQAKAVTALEPSDDAAREFAAMREVSTELQLALERLFLDSAPLAPLGRKYLTF